MAKELLRATDAKKNLEVRVTGRWTGTLAWFGSVVGEAVYYSHHQKLPDAPHLDTVSSSSHRHQYLTV